MKRKKNNNRKAFNNTQSTNTYIQDIKDKQDKGILPNYVNHIENMVRKGEVLRAIKLLRDTNGLGLYECKDVIAEYRETGEWDHFKFAKLRSDLGEKIAIALDENKLLSKDCTRDNLLYVINKIIRQNG